MVLKRIIPSTRNMSSQLYIYGKSKRVIVNMFAVKKHSLAQYLYGIFLYDSDKRKAALKFTNDPEEPGICKIMKYPGTFMLYAKAFIDAIDPKNKIDRKAYKVEWNKKEEMLTFDLNE